MKIILGVAAMAAAGAMSCAAQAATFYAATNAQLVAAISAAKGGDIIRVQPGNYGNLQLKGINPASAVTIIAANSARLPVFTNIMVRESSNLRFVRLAVYSPAAEPGNAALNTTNVWNSSDIRLSGMVFSGVPGGGLIDEPNGLRIMNSQRVQVAESRFQELRNGIIADGSSHLAIADNVFDNIRINGVISDSASASTISRNRLSNFNPEAGDHADGIQIFTSGLRTAGLTISDNLIVSNGASQLQGIFISNNVGTRSLLDRITITDNVMSGTMWHGIAAFQSGRVTVSDNELYSNPLAAAPRTYIRLDQVNSADVSGNRAANFIYSDVAALSASANLVQLDNLGAALAISAWDATHIAGVARSVGGGGASRQALSSDHAGALRGLASLSRSAAVSTFAAGVPEPSAWLQLIAGFGMIGTALRRWSRGAVASEALPRRIWRRMARA